MCENTLYTCQPYFNPRPRKEGDHACDARCASNKKFQSTPSQRGRQSSMVSEMFSTSISIHALAKRATTSTFRFALNFAISIHALAKRATRFLPILSDQRIISIHALAKRATANLYNDYLYFEAKYHISDIFPL